MAKAKQPEKQIALTGATGFVGAHIMAEAAKAGWRVKALTRRPQKEIKNVTWIPGGLEDKAALSALVKDARYVIHCAGIVKAVKERDFFTVNAGGVERMLDAVAPAKPHFVLVSSLAAREPGLSNYAKSKHAGEKVLKDYGAGHPWTIVRPPPVYGPGGLDIIRFLQPMKKGYGLATGDADNRFSLIHARDLAHCILSTLGEKSAFSATIEADDQRAGGYTMHDISRLAADFFERPIKTIAVPLALLRVFAFFNEMGSHITGTPAVISRGKANELAYPEWLADQASHRHVPRWKAKIQLDKGLKETLEWYRAQGLL